MYVVYWNMPGYMPDVEPIECETLEEAKECLVEEVEHYLDGLYLDGGFTEEELLEWDKELLRLKIEPPQECTFWVGDYVFTLTTN